LGRNDKASQYARFAAQDFQQVNDQKGLAAALSVSAQADLWRKQFEDARNQLERALQVNPENAKDKVFLAQAYTGIGNLDQASRTIRDAEFQLGQNQDRAGRAFALKTWGEIAARQNDYPSAIDRLNRSSQLSQQLGDAAGAKSTLTEISQVEDLRRKSKEIPIETLPLYILPFLLIPGVMVPTYRNYLMQGLGQAWRATKNILTRNDPLR